MAYSYLGSNTCQLNFRNCLAECNRLDNVISLTLR